MTTAPNKPPVTSVIHTSTGLCNRTDDKPHTMSISDISVRERHRRDMGDVDALAANIAEVGLLHPVVVRHDGRLIAGERRLLAAKRLGWTKIPVTVVDLAAVVRGEFAENSFRKDFTMSEAVAIKRVLEPLERAAAKGRMLGGRPSEKFSKGRALDKVADMVGWHRTTIRKAEAVVDAAEADPERFGYLVRDMDESGHADRAYKQLKIERAKERHAKTIEHGCTVSDLVELADSGKRFTVIYADPPLPFETWGGLSGQGRSVDNHYNTSPVDEIAKLPVTRLAADNCALLLWCTGPHIAIGTHTKIIAAWGFKPSTVAFDWVKQNPSGDGLHTGMGYWTRSNTEACFLATKGSPMRLATDVHQVVFAPVGEHSEKPAEVRRRIEQLFPGPYLELYGRKLVPGWTVWGNEIRRDQFVMRAERSRVTLALGVRP
jgi:N6-adenosine-specific RNA methylase IME4/ParB-like chromosome segregation protein Spo0J